MSEQGRTDSPLLAKLPSDIVTALKRKASRDPSSRFPKKLHILLTFLETEPQLQDEFGLGWINDSEFRMNKKIVSEIMGIKLNTLNVNLRDLEFVQLQHDKNGWTRWCRDGFNKYTIFTELENPNYTGPVRPQNPGKIARLSDTKTINIATMLKIGHVSAQEDLNFQEIVKSDFLEITQNEIDMPAEMFIKNAANYFKQPEQTLENAIDVITPILRPQENIVTYDDLFRFLAMFGPKNTVMIKIVSLLRSNNEDTSWLYLDPAQKPLDKDFTGTFDKYLPNCLVLKFKDGNVIRVFNHPLIDAFGTYVVDENNHQFASWEEFFQSFVR
ncbi:39 kDa initiator binding protein, putative [Trichomonas vaginalis G3]|uniref:39 kDa initiator binding protein, putative n=1 Tax=Trichomonas vaginalis (strain ATCC PRA-98 / G3) TaxID=412133 RepID=A2FY83_TRIV3|nr:Initiator binding protein 39 kDa family [Trichomonas vaginalis G3]EAX90130.1 39 kDa initiator binding protein, putative [Trichomonas vaginalis G3]KAI5537808.1 Initiator binding protein 39 kDa family [Trichomonas vaginalis G3]|eukprot:XP_001303060.1 39 kDa initiator binding protein [Trichomonas vaginalis G3]